MIRRNIRIQRPSHEKKVLEQEFYKLYIYI